MHPILFHFGTISIYSYGLMVALAFLSGVLVSLYYAQKEGIKFELILDLALYVILSSIIGARLFYVIGQWSYYSSNLLEIVMIQKGGLVFLGGFLFDIVVVVFYAKKKNIPLLKLLDVLAPGAALGYAIGRIGCFLNGCCFGLPTNFIWALKFPPGSLASACFPGEALYPTQLISSISMFVLFILLIIIYRHKKFDGFIFFLWFLWYAIYRFLVEFLRYSPIYWWGLTPSQWIAVFFFVFAVSGLTVNYVNLTKENVYVKIGKTKR